jgi:hypothetical protein
MSGFNFPPNISPFGRSLINRLSAAGTRLLLQLGDMATQNANSLGALSVTDTTPSTSTTNGAFTVAGGLGVAGSLNVGGNAAVGGTLSANIINGAYLASNSYTRTGIALRVPNERLAPGALGYTVSGTATDLNNAFGGDYDNFATFTNGQTIEVDVRPLLGSGGFTYLAAGDIFALTFRSAGGVAPTSALIEVFDSTLAWVPLATISSFTFSGSGWIGFYRHAGVPFVAVRQIRITISTPGTSLLAGFEWFPARATPTDMQQFVPSQSSAIVNILAAGEWRIRASSSTSDRASITASAMGITHGSGVSSLGPGTMRATNLPVFASDAAAAANPIPSGTYYRITGDTTVRCKP